MESLFSYNKVSECADMRVVWWRQVCLFFEARCTGTKKKHCSKLPVFISSKMSPSFTWNPFPKRCRNTPTVVEVDGFFCDSCRAQQLVSDLMQSSCFAIQKNIGLCQMRGKLDNCFSFCNLTKK